VFRYPLNVDELVVVTHFDFLACLSISLDSR
jgi:hypothetical protein